MRRLKKLELERLAKQLHETAKFLTESAEAICERANSDSDDALKNSNGTRNPGHSDPTASAATSRRYDPAGWAAQNLMADLNMAAKASRRAEAHGRSLLAISLMEANRLTHESAANAMGRCANCDVDVLNTRDDRLKAGRCSACYEYRLNHHGNDRPRHLWETTPPSESRSAPELQECDIDSS